MTDDHKLLEKAANAAGFVFSEHGGGAIYDPQPKAIQPYKRWNPLTDDGDALRLAVKLRIEIGFSCQGMQTWAVQPYKDVRVHEHIATNADLSAATRRAIVRAAASIGE